MNIFILHRDPRIAARYHCDKHVNKMITESVQMLSTVNRTVLSNPIGFKSTHAGNSCTRWVGRSRENYLWLCDLTEALTEEFKQRYGRAAHASHNRYVECELRPLATFEQNGGDHRVSLSPNS